MSNWPEIISVQRADDLIIGVFFGLFFICSVQAAAVDYVLFVLVDNICTEALVQT